jgi:large subunit ribosomal protein L30
MLKITLVKSVIGAKPVNQKTVRALGLRKTGRTVYREDSPSTRGMIRNVQHLLKVENVDGVPAKVAKAKSAVVTFAAPKAEPAPKAEKPKKAAAPKAEPKKAAPVAKKPAAKKPAAKKPAPKKEPAKPAGRKPDTDRKGFGEIGKKPAKKKE